VCFLAYFFGRNLFSQRHKEDGLKNPLSTSKNSFRGSVNQTGEKNQQKRGRPFVN